MVICLALFYITLLWRALEHIFLFLTSCFWCPHCHGMVFSFAFSKICCLPLKFSKNPCSLEKQKYLQNFIMLQFVNATLMKCRGHAVGREMCPISQTLSYTTLLQLLCNSYRYLMAGAKIVNCYHQLALDITLQTY